MVKTETLAEWDYISRRTTSVEAYAIWYLGCHVANEWKYQHCLEEDPFWGKAYWRILDYCPFLHQQPSKNPALSLVSEGLWMDQNHVICFFFSHNLRNFIFHDSTNEILQILADDDLAIQTILLLSMLCSHQGESHLKTSFPSTIPLPFCIFPPWRYRGSI